MAREGAPPLLAGLPDEIAIWEILVRLPPTSLLRCRAVSPRLASRHLRRDFLLAHHRRQPALPILCAGSSHENTSSSSIIPFDPAASAADDQLQPPVARLTPGYFTVEASCDGLLLLPICRKSLCVCNLATRQYAPLPLLHGFILAGMYPHAPTAEHRLLLYPEKLELYSHWPPDAPDGYYVLTLGSRRPPRHIGGRGGKI